MNAKIYSINRKVSIHLFGHFQKIIIPIIISDDIRMIGLQRLTNTLSYHKEPLKNSTNIQVAKNNHIPIHIFGRYFFSLLSSFTFLLLYSLDQIKTPKHTSQMINAFRAM
jgi:hypothetical protein